MAHSRSWGLDGLLYPRCFASKVVLEVVRVHWRNTVEYLQNQPSLQWSGIWFSFCTSMILSISDTTAQYIHSLWCCFTCQNGRPGLCVKSIPWKFSHFRDCWRWTFVVPWHPLTFLCLSRRNISWEWLPSYTGLSTPGRAATAAVWPPTTFLRS